MTRMLLFTFRELLVFMSKVEMHFICKAMKLRTSFASLRWLDTESLSHAGNKLDDLPSILILVKTKGLSCLSALSVRNTEDLRVLPFSILLSTEECYCDIDGCTLSNTNDFELV